MTRLYIWIWGANCFLSAVFRPHLWLLRLPLYCRQVSVIVVESAGIYDAITRRTRLQIEFGPLHMSRDATERDPLLHATILADESRKKGKIEKTRIGPLELSRSTRYGILAGIWTATFVSVSGWGYIVVLALIVFVWRPWIVRPFHLVEFRR